jgi:hypothetical protein
MVRYYNGGSVVADQKVREGGTANRPADPVKDLAPGLYLNIESSRYVLEGWYKEAALINLWNFNDTVKSDITLYAGWSGPSPINISDANGNNDVERAVSYVNANANAGACTLLVAADASCAPQRLDAPNARLTIKGLGGNRKISLNANGALFTVGDGSNTGIRLTLGENIALTGRPNNDSALVVVYSAFATMIGGTIYGIDVPLKANTAASGAAVNVDSSGTVQYSGAYGNGLITTTDLTLPPGAK